MGAKYSSPVSALPADRTFIVTGANSGMGYCMAKALAQLGGRVIVACRSEERATKAIEQMNKEHQEEMSKQSVATSTTTKKTKSCTSASGDETKPDKEKADDTNEANAGASGESADKEQPLNLEFMKLDLGSMASVMEFINAFKAKGYPLHTLVCNAGGVPTKQLELTDDDNEMHFQVRYLGHHLILLHLLPLIKQSGPNSRVIFVTGGNFTYKMAQFNPDDIQLKKFFSGMKAAANSQVFQTMSMYAFERRTKGSQIGWFATNPGLAKSSQQGAEVMLRAILDPAYNGREALFFDHKCADNSHNPGPLAKNVEKQEILWKLSLELLKEYVTDDLMKDLQLPADEGGEEVKGEGTKDGGEEAKGGGENKDGDGPKEEDETKGAAAN